MCSIITRLEFFIFFAKNLENSESRFQDRYTVTDLPGNKRGDSAAAGRVCLLGAHLCRQEQCEGAAVGRVLPKVPSCQVS